MDNAQKAYNSALTLYDIVEGECQKSLHFYIHYRNHNQIDYILHLKRSMKSGSVLNTVISKRASFQNNYLCEFYCDKIPFTMKSQGS